MFKIGKETYSSRRPGSPTWSRTSLLTDICQDVFGTQSIYGQYLVGTTVGFPENEANIKFWCIVDTTYFRYEMP
jgi:hypothetical protein